MHQHVEEVAEDTLEAIETFGGLAETKVAEYRAVRYDGGNRPQGWEKTATEQERWKHLLEEPLIGRVRYRTADGRDETLFICRPFLAKKQNGMTLASAKSTKGRIAEFDVGDEYYVEFPEGDRREPLEGIILEKTLVTPARGKDEQWDGESVRLEWDEELYNLDSLRRYLDRESRAFVPAGEIPEALRAAMELEQEEEMGFALTRGVSRQSLMDAGLTAVGILDRIQGRIYRMSIDERLLLIGPPGTGKTTTLVRRISTKLEPDALSRDERELLDSSGLDEKSIKSWRMFSPTELLKQYLEDAFGEEGVAVSQKNLSTWSEVRHELSTDVFPIHRTTRNKEGVVKLDGLNSLKQRSSQYLASVHERFWEYIQDHFDDQGRTRLAAVRDALPEGEIRLSADANRVLSDMTVEAPLRFLARSEQELVRVGKALKERQKQLRLDAIKGMSANRAIVALDIETTKQEDRQDPPKLLLRLVGDYARNLVREQNPRLARGITHRARYLEVLFEHGLTPELPHLRAYGEAIVAELAIERLRTLPRWQGESLPRLYRQFREEMLAERHGYYNPMDKWGAGSSDNNVSPDELDLLVLTAFRLRRRLVQLSSSWDYFSAIQDRLSTQIFVDEVTDFSATQLACMAFMGHPKLQSFFACGDFRQRITEEGITGPSDLEWVSRVTGYGAFALQELDRNYRQSPGLARLSRKLSEILGLPEEGEVRREKEKDKGLAPQLFIEDDPEATASWLVDRILEIDHITDKRPTLAILVEDEAAIEPLAAALEQPLARFGIQVAQCKNGEVIGNPNDVRIFDIQHVKGLEFEAVFVTDLDRLERKYPRLFDRFLYVALTRAATFLGVTARKKLPESLEQLREDFEDAGWSLPGS